jgi:hypothetical protein
VSQAPKLDRFAAEWILRRRLALKQVLLFKVAQAPRS